jgi:hypothetical protein
MTRKEFISWAESCGYHIYDRQGDVFIYTLNDSGSSIYLYDKDKFGLSKVEFVDVDNLESVYKTYHLPHLTVEELYKS